MEKFSVFLSGLLFGAGVTLSAMVDPAKVLNFLDLFGTFDPTLIAVMGGALIVTLPGYRLLFHRGRPILAETFDLPKASGIDARLMGGATLFGIGWGLAGFCPGPVVASLVFGNWPSFLFVAAMAAGMLIGKTLGPVRSAQPA
jgi:uncharacterized protein